MTMPIAKYSLGTGDRFGQQGRAQLRAVAAAQEQGVDLAIVWNKSHREHAIIGSEPGDVRREAEQAVHSLEYWGQYFVDADHVSRETVDPFLASSDFFTLDVAEQIGVPAATSDLDTFVERQSRFLPRLAVPGIERPLSLSRDELYRIGETYLGAVREAAELYRHISRKRGGDFITEVSLDEAAEPQGPIELFFILAALAEAGVPLQTIAPKFSGRFNKGVDYRGDIERFRQEFEEDLCVLACARQHFGLPADLKLSVHSGSDKFSIYGPIRELIRKHDAGIHVKTAGTTWLEELIGLAEAGGEGLMLAKRVYAAAHARLEELCSPYTAVIDIDRTTLPEPRDVDNWTSERYVRALRHDPSCPQYNAGLRQLLHVGYKIAAEMGEDYLNILRDNEAIVAGHVSENLFERHIVPLFLSQ